MSTVDEPLRRESCRATAKPTTPPPMTYLSISLASPNAFGPFLCQLARVTLLAHLLPTCVARS
jgi:hypothetical protein